MSRRYYFAYGSNMDEKQMDFRCPNAELVGRARLPGWKFRINTRGVATVVPDEESTVHGVLWIIGESDEETLDYYEGVSSGFYVKRTETVYREDGDAVEALLYVASDDGPGSPRPGYLERIVAAARRHGLPRHYIEELQGWSKAGT
ncbi:gamma-glutamylcyclotransferase [Thermomicrobiaceae bacterium CFH 74404]|uniref:Gamma-glutamylcyclotransferase n=1 Tax=Thermalbibacter longus TaxID=2951981 RepID=A0AA41WEE4_9BACT|nr:gamma-glutamylcyclotransferase family protein [Thermalbibacter longus]MCM8748505.1 gamma-glutamylcyclotransferase [Thermalbibacter longus]